MNLDEIKQILPDCARKFKSVNTSLEYQRIQDSLEFTSCNNFVLGDAIQTLYEVQAAISND